MLNYAARHFNGQPFVANSMCTCKRRLGLKFIKRLPVAEISKAANAVGARREYEGAGAEWFRRRGARCL